ncbi:MAG: AAA family ATPase [Endomicrobium sp.]|jgi:superfamily I DNA/RNA helicase|nr:AAA family ATPase [Endomicrobium sp.]
MAERKLILAVAGSGKTKYLIDRLNLKERFVIITYTNTNLNLIKNRIVKRFGYHPNNIRTQEYFGFLYNFCIKPFVLFKYKIKGICFNRPKKFYSQYINEEKCFYYNRLGKFAEDKGIIDDIKARLERFYDYLFFDEFQDLGGHDFNFITQVAQANIGFLFVGDFFQNTYVTSDDGNVNCNLYKDLEKYCCKLKQKTGFNS